MQSRSQPNFIRHLSIDEESDVTGDHIIKLFLFKQSGALLSEDIYLDSNLYQWFVGGSGSIVQLKGILANLWETEISYVDVCEAITLAGDWNQTLGLSYVSLCLEIVRVSQWGNHLGQSVVLVSRKWEIIENLKA